MKTLTISIYFTFVTFGLFSQSSDFTCLTGDCQNGYGSSNAANESYTGFFKNEKYNGYGAAVNTLGNLYIGLFTNGNLHGFGTIKGQSDLYIGNLVDGSKNGIGIEVDVNNDLIYEGEFKNGHYNGDGYKYDRNEGMVYYAFFKDGRVNKLYSKSPISMEENTKYRCLSGNCENGKGYIRTASSLIYGEFKNGVLEGEGAAINGESSIYFGEFKAGHKEGIGYVVQKSLIYHGDFKAGLANGKGTIYYSSGEYFTGEFVNYSKEGYGKSYNKNGRKSYAGTYAHNEKNGKGILYRYVTNEIIHGVWNEEELVTITSKEPIDPSKPTGGISQEKLTEYYLTCTNDEDKPYCLGDLLSDRVMAFMNSGYIGDDLYTNVANDIRTINLAYDTRIATGALIMSDVAVFDGMFDGVLQNFEPSEQEAILFYVDEILNE